VLEAYFLRSKLDCQILSLFLGNLYSLAYIICHSLFTRRLGNQIYSFGSELQEEFFMPSVEMVVFELWILFYYYNYFPICMLHTMMTLNLICELWSLFIDRPNTNTMTELDGNLYQDSNLVFLFLFLSIIIIIIILKKINNIIFSNIYEEGSNYIFSSLT
jgi:hypothetical protein